MPSQSRDLSKERLVGWLRELRVQLKTGDVPLVYSRICKTIDNLSSPEVCLVNVKPDVFEMLTGEKPWQKKQ